jgi:hypothetical protein
VWSPRAEELVKLLIGKLPAEQLDPARTHAARLQALPIGGSMWADYYLRPNGQVVIVGDDFDHPRQTACTRTGSAFYQSWSGAHSGIRSCGSYSRSAGRVPSIAAAVLYGCSPRAE